MIDQEIFTKFNLEKDMLPFQQVRLRRGRITQHNLF